MAVHIFDLPGTPLFPVYGLGPQFVGYRWLVIWNAPDKLYTVSLGHGHPDTEPTLTVTTVLKTPRTIINDDVLIATGPTGYDDALFSALCHLADHARLQGSAHGQWVADRLNETDWSSADERDRPSHLGDGWVGGEIVVDGQARTAATLHFGDRWATLIDLPTVVISIEGSAPVAGLATPIVDVRDALDSYV